jgi:hypothetical protein
VARLGATSGPEIICTAAILVAAAALDADESGVGLH